MENKEKAARIAGTTGRQARKSCCGGSLPLHFDFSNSTGKKQEVFIAPLLSEGEETAVTARDLAAMIGVSDPRVITRAIERERLNGIPICAGDNGYYLPMDMGELARYLEAFQRRRAQTAATEKALRLALDRMTEQQRIDGG